MRERSRVFAVRIRGDLACFTRPELKTERVSYEVITPSAARGILEAILWKPAIRWHVKRIKVLSPVRFVAFRRNEVNKKVPTTSARQWMKGKEVELYFADEDRAQRNTVALRDVDYVIEAFFELTERAGPEDNLAKFEEMFQRRLSKGQHFHAPYLGCREFAACVELADGTERPIEDSRDLGLMLHDLYYGTPIKPHFFPARMEQGVVDVPVMAAGGVQP